MKGRLQISRGREHVRGPVVVQIDLWQKKTDVASSAVVLMINLPTGKPPPELAWRSRARSQSGAPSLESRPGSTMADTRVRDSREGLLFGSAAIFGAVLFIVWLALVIVAGRRSTAGLRAAVLVLTFTGMALCIMMGALYCALVGWIRIDCVTRRLARPAAGAMVAARPAPGAAGAATAAAAAAERTSNDAVERETSARRERRADDAAEREGRTRRESTPLPASAEPRSTLAPSAPVALADSELCCEYEYYEYSTEEEIDETAEQAVVETLVVRRTTRPRKSSLTTTDSMECVD